MVGIIYRRMDFYGARAVVLSMSKRARRKLSEKKFNEANHLVNQVLSVFQHLDLEVINEKQKYPQYDESQINKHRRYIDGLLKNVVRVDLMIPCAEAIRH